MKKRVLFLCTGNAARSQMAEALARADYGDVLDPVSAGSRPAELVHHLAIHAIEELGISMDGAHTKGADEFAGAPFDVVVTVCDSASQDCPTWPGAKRIEHWSIEDPSWTDPEIRFARFRETRDELRRRIGDLVASLSTPSPSGRGTG
ncbi:MAG TPA: arsenate reductase ArsC [Thermoanaerobaculia bacterium]